MSKGWLLIFAMIFTAACSSGPSTAPQTADTSPYCAAQASARVSDAAANGFDHELQQKIYDRTYADCVVWSSKTTTSGIR